LALLLLRAAVWEETTNVPVLVSIFEVSHSRRILSAEAGISFQRSAVLFGGAKA
jgi:hypothetical protein